MPLRPYQRDVVVNVRNKFRNNKCVFLCLPTGAGKTVIFSEITKMSVDKGNTVWIVVPRDLLIWQASENIVNLGLTHGVLAPGFQEDKKYDVHIVSKDTWTKRKDSILTIPNLIIVDEGHLSTDRYVQMKQMYPNTFFLFVSATPERLDGKSLECLAPYDALVLGPSIEELIRDRFLSDMRYYCPPISGLDTLKRHGNEIDPDEFEQWLNEKKIYGKSIENYKIHMFDSYGKERQSIIFCRDVKSAKNTAQKYQDEGIFVESVDGSMNKRSVRNIISAVKERKLSGITSCELVTYGLDVPNISLIVMLRHTFSRPLFFQMLGRGLRPEDMKDFCVFLDHVGNGRRHCGNNYPWQKIEWNYCGKKVKRKEEEKNKTIKYCPYIDFMLCHKPSCLGCEHNPTDKPIKEWIEVEGSLVPIQGSIDVKQRPNDEKKYYNDEIQKLKKISYDESGNINEEAIKQLLELSEATGRKPLWIYFLCKNLDFDLTGEERRMHVVDILLLETIGKIKGYKPGWSSHAKKIILGEK